MTIFSAEYAAFSEIIQNFLCEDNFVEQSEKGLRALPMKDKLLLKNVQSNIKHAILFLKKKFLGLNKSFYVKNYLSLQIIVTRKILIDFRQLI